MPLTSPDASLEPFLALRLAPHSTRAQPGNHTDLGRACLGSARALDAREPVSEEGAQEFRLLVG